MCLCPQILGIFLKFRKIFFWLDRRRLIAVGRDRAGAIGLGIEICIYFISYFNTIPLQIVDSSLEKVEIRV